MVWALGCILLVYFLLSAQVIKYMGLDFSLSGDALQRRAVRLIDKAVGMHRVDMSMMLAGASWAVIAFSQLFERKWIKFALWGAAATILLGQALTGGRAGYVTWGGIGLFLCCVKWWRLLPLIPVGAIAVATLMPGVRERMLQGFGIKTGAMQEVADHSQITAGRADIWPYVVEEIKESVFFGNGRLGMQTTGLTLFASTELNDVFGHPHNAYLEMLLDNGIVGFLGVIAIYLIAVRRSYSLFQDRNDRLYEVVGGVALALTLALLVASMGAQSLYPRTGVIGMWAAVGVALRVFRERQLEGYETVGGVAPAEPEELWAPTAGRIEPNP